MRHVSRNAFFVIIMLHVNVSLYGMLLRRIPKQTLGTTRAYPRSSTTNQKFHTSIFHSKLPASEPEKTPIPKQLPQNPSSTTFFERLKSNTQALKSRAQQWWQQLLAKRKAQVKQKIVGKEAQDIIEEIKIDPLKAIDSFATFIVKNNQNAVDELLDHLIIFGKKNKDNEVEFLELVITAYALHPKIDTYIIIEKLVNWASWRVMDLLNTSTFTHEIVIYLMSLDSRKKLASEIVNNYERINGTKAGSYFINHIIKNQPTPISDTFQRSAKNRLEKIKEMASEKWQNVLSAVEKKYDIPMPSVLKKKSIEQWQKEIDKAAIELRQRINNKKAQIAREQSIIE